MRVVALNYLCSNICLWYKVIYIIYFFTKKCVIHNRITVLKFYNSSQSVNMNLIFYYELIVAHTEIVCNVHLNTLSKIKFFYNIIF